MGLGIAVAVVLLLGCALLYVPFRWRYLEGLWGFWLNGMPGGRTRLVIGGYQAIRPRWLERIVFGGSNVFVVWIMQARMLAVLKRTIEQAANAPAPPVAEPAPARRR